MWWIIINTDLYLWMAACSLDLYLIYFTAFINNSKFKYYFTLVVIFSCFALISVRIVTVSRANSQSQSNSIKLEELLAGNIFQPQLPTTVLEITKEKLKNYDIIYKWNQKATDFYSRSLLSLSKAQSADAFKLARQKNGIEVINVVYK